MQTNKIDEKARKLPYHEFPEHYVWKPDEKKWVERQKGTCIGRVYHISPSFGELFYLRVLLNKVRAQKIGLTLRSLRVLHMLHIKKLAKLEGY